MGYIIYNLKLKEIYFKMFGFGVGNFILIYKMEIFRWEIEMMIKILMINLIFMFKEYEYVLYVKRCLRI